MKLKIKNIFTKGLRKKNKKKIKTGLEEIKHDKLKLND
jgi:hypothetical protein